MSDHFRLCMHLDASGRPCNRRTTKPLTMCSLHRPKAPGGHSRSKDAQTRAQRKHRERMSNAGVATAWEGA